MAAGRRWLNATAHGPWASRSWPSSMVWAVWSEALAQRSWPLESTSISPAASAANSWLAPSAICCRVEATPVTVRRPATALHQRGGSPMRWRDRRTTAGCPSGGVATRSPAWLNV